MEKFKRILKRIIFLPPLPTVLIALPSFALVTYVLITEADGVIAYFSYIASAYALTLVITLSLRFGDYAKKLRERMNEHPLTKRIMSVPLLNLFLTDPKFRTKIMLYFGFSVNLLYIVMKMLSGIYYRSVWFISIAVYYILLAVMRFVLVRRGKAKGGRSPMEVELRRYRKCGIMLLIMNQALTAIVVLIVQQNQGYEYPGLLIYAMAAYSFYAVITAVVNLVKFRKHGSPVMSAAKAISLVAALVSLLSLTTAMLAQFGGEETTEFRQIMTGAVGGGVCTIVLAMAIFMIWKASKNLKKIKINNSLT